LGRAVSPAPGLADAAFAHLTLLPLLWNVSTGCFVCALVLCTRLREGMGKLQSSASPITGLQKAAVLAVALGPERAAQLFSGLGPDEAEMLASEIALIEQIDEGTRAQVLNEFLGASQLAPAPVVAPPPPLQVAPTPALVPPSRPALEYLANTPVPAADGEREADRLSELLAHQHPQLAAVVLLQLPPALAARVMEGQRAQIQAEWARRLIEMQPANPGAVRRLSVALESRFLAGRILITDPSDGASRLADILSYVSRYTERLLLDTLREEIPELCQKLYPYLFGFDDFAALEAEALALVCGEVSEEDVILALHATNQELREHLLSALPPSLSARVRKEVTERGLVRWRRGREAQQRLVEAARLLAGHEAIALHLYQAPRGVTEEPSPEDAAEREGDRD
jgi:flagellar motor switch protein FliG